MPPKKSKQEMIEEFRRLKKEKKDLFLKELAEKERRRAAEIALYYENKKKREAEFQLLPLEEHAKVYSRVNRDPDITYGAGKKATKATDPDVLLRAVNAKDCLLWAAVVNERKSDDSVRNTLINQYINEGANVNSFSLCSSAKPENLDQHNNKVWRTPLLYAVEQTMYGENVSPSLTSLIDVLLSKNGDPSIEGIHRYSKYETSGSYSVDIAERSSLSIVSLRNRYDINKLVEVTTKLSKRDKSTLLIHLAENCYVNVKYGKAVSSETLQKLLNLGADVIDPVLRVHKNY